MIKTIILIFMSCMGVVNYSYSQNSTEREFLKNKIPKEQVYLHLNSTFLFSGETLLYKFYCLDANTTKISALSQVGWVTLINSDKKKVFQHKLDLSNGQAYSDFFITSDLPTGAYKILGYTSWMLNDKENYFEQDIYIINPYLGKTKALNAENTLEDPVKNIKLTNSSDFKLELNKESFSKREKVELSLKNLSEVSGDFSISVRRLDSLSKPSKIKSTNFDKLYDSQEWNFSDTLILPEVRGSLVFGKVTGGFQSGNLFISFPGEESQINIASIDDDGKFNFTVKKGLSSDQVLIQAMDYMKKDFSVELYENVDPNYTSLNFDEIYINKSLRDYILNRSINNQIENAYTSTKSDRPLLSEDKGYFFNDKLLVYNLDEYKRFSTVKETFVEIINNAQVKRNDDNTQSIFIRNVETVSNIKFPALLIVDGVIVQNHNKLISFDAEKISTIGILNHKLFFGPETFYGVIVVETNEGDFPEEFMEDFIESIKIVKAQNQKQYYSPNYDEENLDRIPDYRSQLWWEPEISFLNVSTHSFFTSDVSGRFEVNLEGFLNNGKPISISKIFYVD